MTKLCPGCGSLLQSKDKNKIGYTPKKDAKLCERCFKLKNYNIKEVIDLKYSNEDIINLVSTKDGAIFFITDFLNVSNKVIDTFKKINHHNKYLVINKADFIPRSIAKNNYVNYVKETYNISSKVILISAVKNYNLNELINIIKSYKNSYICGYTNSGKSTIINKISELFGKDGNILTSLMPNTTLDLIKIRLDENVYIFDTPGFINDFDFDENSFPKSFVKPITIQTKANDIIKIGDNIFIKCDGCSNSFTFYISDLIKVKKVYGEYDSINNNVFINDNSDLVLYGYGFINIKNKCNLLINTNNFEVRKSYF